MQKLSAEEIKKSIEERKQYKEETIRRNRSQNMDRGAMMIKFNRNFSSEQNVLYNNQQVSIQRTNSK